MEGILDCQRKLALHKEGDLNLRLDSSPCYSMLPRPEEKNGTLVYRYRGRSDVTGAGGDLVTQV